MPLYATGQVRPIRGRWILDETEIRAGSIQGFLILPRPTEPITVTKGDFRYPKDIGCSRPCTWRLIPACIRVQPCILFGVQNLPPEGHS